MANNFQIWKKLQANFIEPINTQYARAFTSKLYIKKSLLQSTISIKLKKLNGSS